MTISDYQISSVIKTYMKNMKTRVKSLEKEPTNGNGTSEDSVRISEEGIKKMLFNRIGEQMTERLKRHD
jgi:hypothetical protein